MATKPLPILRGVTLAYEDVWRGLGVMRTLMLYALLIILAFKVIDNVVLSHAINGGLTGTVLGFAIAAAQSFCLTPIMIAIHRYIILDEVTATYAVDPSEPSFIAFFGWWMAVSLLIPLVIAVSALLQVFGFSAGAAIGPTMMVTIVVIILLLRLAILFPAIAVGVRGATAGDALADSKGHVFLIFLIFTLALLPLTAISLGITSILGRDIMSRGTPAALIGLVLDSVIHLTSLVLCVVIASSIFQAIGNRLRMPGPAR
jgi:hypothetical protein